MCRCEVRWSPAARWAPIHRAGCTVFHVFEHAATFMQWPVADIACMLAIPAVLLVRHTAGAKDGSLGHPLQPVCMEQCAGVRLPALLGMVTVARGFLMCIL